MNRAAYDSLVEQAIDEVVNTIGSGERQPSPTRVLAALRTLAQRVGGYSRDYTLLNLRTVEDVAAEFGVSTRRIRDAAADRHARYGVGMKFGRSWVWSAEEVEVLRPHYHPSK